ncbi:MAG TPA: hypothetical protein VFP68_16520, partial [Burkholderiaceae bacterium]|nr:hypothetical protein [Burkholderiaceae bacterium]
MLDAMEKERGGRMIKFGIFVLAAGYGGLSEWREMHNDGRVELAARLGQDYRTAWSSISTEKSRLWALKRDLNELMKASPVSNSPDDDLHWAERAPRTKRPRRALAEPILETSPEEVTLFRFDDSTATQDVAAVSDELKALRPSRRQMDWRPLIGASAGAFDSYLGEEQAFAAQTSPVDESGRDEKFPFPKSDPTAMFTDPFAFGCVEDFGADLEGTFVSRLSSMPSPLPPSAHRNRLVPRRIHEVSARFAEAQWEGMQGKVG